MNLSESGKSVPCMDFEAAKLDCRFDDYIVLPFLIITHSLIIIYIMIYDHFQYLF